MSAQDYASTQTFISVREQNFLGHEDYEALMQAESSAQIVRMLEESDYHLEEADLNDPDAIEAELMRELAKEYRLIYANSPNQYAADVTASKYMFHNLKVQMKIVATDLDLDHLIIPIGPYSTQELFHLAQTMESSIIDASIVQNVQSTWEEYQSYEDTEVIDVGMDMAYFDYLHHLKGYFNDPKVKHVIDMEIDFYNAITGMRALKQGKPNSFMYEMMSNQGATDIRTMIDIVRQGRLAQWFDRVNQLKFDLTIRNYLESMTAKNFTARQLENIAEMYLHQYMADARLSGAGPIHIIRYLYGREMEVKNLRLILTGRANDLSMEGVRERMRPIYGERI